MDNRILLEEKLHGYSEAELTKYIYKNVDSLTTVSFSALKKEIAFRKNLPNDVKMLIGNIQDLRNQNFIKEIFPYLYSKNKKIKTAKDLIADLKKNEIGDPDITLLLQQLPKIIEKNTAQSRTGDAIKTAVLLCCIVVAVLSFTFFTITGVIIALLALLAGLYFFFIRNNYSRVRKLKTNIECHLQNSTAVAD